MSSAINAERIIRWYVVLGMRLIWRPANGIPLGFPKLVGGVCQRKWVNWVLRWRVLLKACMADTKYAIAPPVFCEHPISKSLSRIPGFWRLIVSSELCCVQSRYYASLGSWRVLMQDTVLILFFVYLRGFPLPVEEVQGFWELWWTAYQRDKRWSLESTRVDLYGILFRYL